KPSQLPSLRVQTRPPNAIALKPATVRSANSQSGRSSMRRRASIIHPVPSAFLVVGKESASTSSSSNSNYPPANGQQSYQRLFWRAGVGVRLYVTSLLVHDAAQFALHGFESVVDHFVKRLVRAVVHLPFISNELVATRNGQINAAAIRISFVMRVISLLNRHIAAVDVVAKSFQSRRIFQNEIVNLVGFFQTPVRDFNRQLHD